MKSRSLTVGITSVAGILLTASSALAAPVEQSFADAFFIARRADGGLEVLGSVVIWLLLGLSVFGIGLIVSMAVANRRETIMPSPVARKVGGHLRDGRYEDAMAVAEADDSYFSRVLTIKKKSNR